MSDDDKKIEIEAWSHKNNAPVSFDITIPVETEIEKGSVLLKIYINQLKEQIATAKRETAKEILDEIKQHSITDNSKKATIINALRLQELGKKWGVD